MGHTLKKEKTESNSTYISFSKVILCTLYADRANATTVRSLFILIIPPQSEQKQQQKKEITKPN